MKELVIHIGIGKTGTSAIQKAIKGIEMIKETYFEVEKGLNDGTFSHGIERFLPFILNANNYRRDIVV